MRTPAKTALVVTALAALALAGCDKPKDRTPKTDPATATAAPPAGALPALPEWSQAMIGKAKADLFPGEMKPCKGNTDNVDKTFADGVRVVGWAWDPATQEPVPRVILVDVTGLVAGAGETGIARPDVNRVVPEIKSPATGWSALTSRTTGPLETYGIIDGGKSLCVLGHVAF
jgi:hypothetical protein